MLDFSALAGSYPELGVLWAQLEGWNHTAELFNHFADASLRVLC